MTLKELSEHPERASDEDIKHLTETFRILKEMGKQMAPLLNGVTSESGRTKEEISHSYYEEMMLMAAILESFLKKPEQEFKDISKFVFNYTDKALFWDMPVTIYYICLRRLCAVGLLEMTKEDKYNPSFTITKEGYDALRQRIYANLAQTALFNLRTQQLNDESLKLNRRAVRQNRLMLVVAIASTIAAFVSVLFTFIQLFSC